MARERSEMRRVKEVLRLRLVFGLSHKAIGAACRMPRTTVRDYCQRAKAAGIDSFAAVEPLSERVLEARLFTTGVDPDAPDPDVAKPSAGRPTPDWATVHRELKKPGVTRRLLWHEYLAQHPGAYRYTQFTRLYKAWAASAVEPRMRRVHQPGAMIEVDYAGMTLPIRIGNTIRAAAVFTACLPYSGRVPGEPRPEDAARARSRPRARSGQLPLGRRASPYPRLVGPTGIGKTWIVCVLGKTAGCRHRRQGRVSRHGRRDPHHALSGPRVRLVIEVLGRRVPGSVPLNTRTATADFALMVVHVQGPRVDHSVGSRPERDASVAKAPAARARSSIPTSMASTPACYARLLRPPATPACYARLLRPPATPACPPGAILAQDGLPRARRIRPRRGRGWLLRGARQHHRGFLVVVALLAPSTPGSLARQAAPLSRLLPVRAQRTPSRQSPARRARRRLGRMRQTQHPGSQQEP